MLHIVHITCGVVNKGDPTVMMTMVIKLTILAFLLTKLIQPNKLIVFSVTKAKPLGCMSDALASASASFEVLQRQLSDCTNNVEQLQQNITLSRTSANSPMLPASLTTLMVRDIELSYLVIFVFDLDLF